MTSYLEPAALEARMLHLEHRLRRLRSLVAILAVGWLALTTAAMKQRAASVLEGNRLVLHGSDSTYAELQVVDTGRLQVRVHLPPARPDKRDSTWLAVPQGAGLELVGGRQPMLLLTNATGAEVLRLGPWMRPLQR